MPLTDEQYQSLLAQKGVGKTVIERLTQMGLDDIHALAHAEPADVLTQGAVLTGSSCWQNSPQAKAAISNAIAWAKLYLDEQDIR